MSVSQQPPEAPKLSNKTFGNQHLLPRVPLPDLEGTCSRFIEWCAPLLTADELAETKSRLDNFARPGGPAEILHADLKAYDQRPDVKSWLDDFWDTRYLGRRDRIALNANFFFMFHKKEITQTARAAELTAAALNFKLRLDKEEIPPATRRGSPLDMNQMSFLFSSTRIPGVPLDSMCAPPIARPNPDPQKPVTYWFSIIVPCTVWMLLVQMDIPTQFLILTKPLRRSRRPAHPHSKTGKP